MIVRLAVIAKKRSWSGAGLRSRYRSTLVIVEVMQAFGRVVIPDRLVRTLVSNQEMPFYDGSSHPPSSCLPGAGME